MSFLIDFSIHSRIPRSDVSSPNPTLGRLLCKCVHNGDFLKEIKIIHSLSRPRPGSIKRKLSLYNTGPREIPRDGWAGCRWLMRETLRGNVWVLVRIYESGYHHLHEGA